MINAQIAIQNNSVESFLDNWRFSYDADDNATRLANDFTPFETSGDRPTTIDVYNSRFCVVPLTAQGLWKKDTGAGGRSLVSLYVADIQDAQGKLEVLDYLRTNFAGPFVILDVWNEAGTRFGQTLIHATYDDEGNELTPENITGQPTYTHSTQ